MSTLKADTIQSTGGGAATLTNQSASKAHVKFNGSGTIAITGYTINVSSLTDNGTGDYTATLTNSLAANEGMHMRTSNNYICWESSTGAANQMWIAVADASGNLTDTGRCYCSVHGDLA